ncbi:MAG: inositol monophosphatase [Spirochaetota bacterium]|nr:MAG: inositol monophosphatase [Spirochaetota bacterium]
MKKLTKKAYTTALNAAKAAGKYLLQKFHEDDTTVIKSYPHDIKLHTDVETEELIKQMLKRRFPDHSFICEESGTEHSQSEFSWVIDPLDGTVNYAQRIPHFCTSIALKKGSEYLVGVVFDPVKNELFSAIKGEGAWLNGSPLHKKNVGSLSDAIITGGFMHEGALQKGKKTFTNLVNRIKKLRLLGSAALDLCYLAANRVNGYIHYSTHEWDIAAASLVATQSGARVDIYERDGALDVIAADETIFDELKKTAVF